MSKEKKTLAPSVVTSRDPKGLKFVSIPAASFDKARLSDEEAQRVNEAPGLAALIDSFIEENRHNDRFKNEEVKSSYVYPPEYTGVKAVETQVEAILAHFPGLDPEPTFRYMRDVYQKLVLPDWVEGPFLSPHEYILTEKFGLQGKDRAEQYCASLNLAFQKMAASRAFYNYRSNEIDPEHLVRSMRTAEAIDRLIELQGNAQILVHPAQFALRHRGRSVRRVREIMLGTPEFGEGSLEVICFALAHPERFVRWEQLHADAAGDEFRSDGSGEFGKAPYVNFSDSKVEFGTGAIDDPLEDYGTVSGCLPQ